MSRYVAFVFLLGLVVAATWVRVLVDGRGELAGSDAALAAQDLPSAIVHARRAASAYVPFAGHVQTAYDRLRAIAEQAEARRDYDLALSAWRAIRSASVGSRSLFVPQRARRAQAEAAIARLVAAVSDPAGRGGRSATETGALERLLLHADPPPPVGWVLARAFAVIGVVAAAVWASRPASARIRGPLVLLGSAVAVWIVGFWFA